jgi:hypothetical protein
MGREMTGNRRRECQQGNAPVPSGFNETDKNRWWLSIRGKGEIMETFKKRQKAAARREKQQKKFARRMERKIQKATTPGQIEEENPNMAELVSRRGPTIL